MEPAEFSRLQFINCDIGGFEYEREKEKYWLYKKAFEEKT